MVPDPGEHSFEIEAVFEEGNPSAVMTATGVIVHDVIHQASLPIGHTLVKNVDLWDGHLTASSQDVVIPGRIPLEFGRSYSSGGVESSGPLGAGWSHSADVRLIRDSCGRYVVIGGEGSGNVFVNPHPDPARAALFSSTTVTFTATDQFFDPQIGYHSTLVRKADNLDVFEFFTKSHMRYHFERDGMQAGEVYTLRFIADPNGNRITYGYKTGVTGASLLDRVSDDAGRALGFTYATIANNQRIVQVAVDVGDAALDFAVDYEYDDFGNLTVVTRTTPLAGLGFNDQRVEHYAYSVANPDDRHNLVSYTNPDGNVTEYGYYQPTDAIPGYVDAFLVPKHEFIKEVREPEGVTTRFVYTISTDVNTPNLRAVSDPRPGIPPTVYTLNAYGATVQVDAPLGKTTRTIWCTDAVPAPECNGRRDALRAAEIDPAGRVHRFRYDDLGNLVEESIDFAALLATGYAPVRDQQGQAVSQVTVRYTYDPLFSALTSQTDAENNTTWHCIDSPSQPPPGSPCAATAGKTGKVLATIDAEGQRSESDYYPNGDLRASRDAMLNETLYADYDAYGNAARVIDAAGNTGTYRYDVARPARGRLGRLLPPRAVCLRWSRPQGRGAPAGRSRRAGHAPGHELPLSPRRRPLADDRRPGAGDRVRVRWAPAPDPHHRARRGPGRRHDCRSGHPVRV